MNLLPRQDANMLLKAVEYAMANWRQFVEPLAGSVASIAQAVRDGTLAELIKQRLEEAIKKELERVGKEVDSCLALLNYTQNQYEKEQVVRGTFELRGTPSQGVENFLSSVAFEDLVWENFRRDAVNEAEPQAQSCYDQAQTLATNLPTSQEEAVDGGAALATAMTYRILDDAGLGSVSSVIQTIAPAIGDLSTHIEALNRTMRLAEATYKHLLNENGDGPNWQALLRVALLLAFGWGAPPAQLLFVDSKIGSVEQTAPFAGYSVFSSASTLPSRNELQGGPDSTFPPTSSSACVQEGYTSFMPSLRREGELTGGSALANFGNAIVDSAQVILALPLASPLWQPPLFLEHNWMLDADSLWGTREASWVIGSNIPHMGRYSPLCTASFLTYGQVLPGTSAPAGSTLALVDADVAPVVADPLFPRFEAAASLVQMLNGSAYDVAAICENATSTPTVVELPPHIAASLAALAIDPALTTTNVTIDLELCAFATGYAHNQAVLHAKRVAKTIAAAEAVADAAAAFALDNCTTALYAEATNLTALVDAATAYGATTGEAELLADVVAGCNASYFNDTGTGVPVHANATDLFVGDIALPPPPKHFSARPKLIVRGVNGEPLPGRYCKVVDTEGSHWYDILTLEISVDSCGPSNELGEIEIIGLRVRGGATRELKLAAEVEGVRAMLSNATVWRQDARLYYLSAEQPNYAKIDLVFLQGHDSVRLLALLALPLFALNGRSFKDHPPHLVWRIGAVGAFSFFLWISVSMLHRTNGPPGLDWGETQRTSLFLMATNDITPIRSAASSRCRSCSSRSCSPSPSGSSSPLRGCSYGMSARTWPRPSTWRRRSVASRVREGRAATSRAVANVRTGCAASARPSRAALVDRRQALRRSGPPPAPADAPPPLQKGRGGADGAFAARRRTFERAECAQVDQAGQARERCDQGQDGDLPLRLHRRSGSSSVVLTFGYLVASCGRRRRSRASSSPPRQRGRAHGARRRRRGSRRRPAGGTRRRRRRRMRAARNHVRTMLLGRRGYAIYKRRQHKSFFYPQRLWMALALSLWIQVLITLFFINMVRWTSSALTAAQEFDAKMSVEAQHHAAIDEVTRFAPTSACSCWVSGASLARRGRGAIVHAALIGTGLGVPLVQSGILLFNWYHVFVLYRERVMKMRRGVYFFDRNIYREEYASSTSATRSPGMTLSGFFFMARACHLACPSPRSSRSSRRRWAARRTSPSRRGSSRRRSRGRSARSCSPSDLQLFFNLWVFFTGPRSNKWLRHRFWYALYEYNTIFTNTLVGIAVMFTRFAFWLHQAHDREAL